MNNPITNDHLAVVALILPCCKGRNHLEQIGRVENKNFSTCNSAIFDNKETTNAMIGMMRHAPPYDDRFVSQLVTCIAACMTPHITDKLVICG